MTPVIYSLPFDPQGDNPRNRIVREFHDLTRQVGFPYRVITLDHGYFFSDSVEIQDESGYQLDEADFQCIAISAEATMETGQEVASVIVIVNPNVGHKVWVNASMVGGTYCNLSPAIAQVSLGLLNPTRNPTWRNVTGKPDKFDVGGHLHAMWELYGFEAFCKALEDIAAIKKKGTAEEYRAIGLAFNRLIDALYGSLDSVDRALTEHIAQPNPHGTTKTDIGLGNVVNAGVITATEAAQPDYDSPDRYLTPGHFRTMLNVGFVADMNDHIGNKNNPHNVTAEQIGTRTKGQVDNEFRNKLGKNETAVSTHRVNGMGYSALYTYMVSNQDVSQIKSGTILMDRLTNSNLRTSDYALVGNNQVVHLADRIKPYIRAGTKIVYLANANGKDISGLLTQTYNSLVTYPVGTLALVRIRYLYDPGWDNGDWYSYDYWRVRCYIRNAQNSWVQL